MQKVIFLDFDGVLTTQSTGYRWGDPACVAQLNRITDQTGAVIVVSSTWRHDPNIASILFGWGVTAQVIGITPDLSHRACSGLAIAKERWCEIQHWLTHNPEERTFVILDDEDDMGELLPHLVQTNTMMGLRFNDATTALALLGKKVLA